MNSEITQQLDRIESLQIQLADQLKEIREARVQKEFYSVAEVARILEKAEFTVREWARNGRIHATRQQSGFGPNKSWRISHGELLRIQHEGLLPAKHGKRIEVKLLDENKTLTSELIIREYLSTVWKRR